MASIHDFAEIINNANRVLAMWADRREGGEVHEPTAADWQDYREWCDEYERERLQERMERDEIEAARQWYQANPSFSAWLEANGGEAE